MIAYKFLACALVALLPVTAATMLSSNAPLQRRAASNDTGRVVTIVQTISFTTTILPVLPSTKFTSTVTHTSTYFVADPSSRRKTMSICPNGYECPNPTAIPSMFSTKPFSTTFRTVSSSAAKSTSSIDFTTMIPSTSTMVRGFGTSTPVPSSISSEGADTTPPVSDTTSIASSTTKAPQRCDFPYPGCNM